jgi:hypothetical protein
MFQSELQRQERAALVLERHPLGDVGGLKAYFEGGANSDLPSGRAPNPLPSAADR